MDNNEKIKKIFCEVLGLAESDVNDDTAYNSVNQWDSFEHLIMISKFEEVYGIEFDTVDIIAMNTFANVKTIVNKYL
ncbi:acyl carrier protein [Methanosphaerula subterraneus]|uniref:acyl carrier protein n=1 Tax=Methanosphaerula subterraneus TaxID=3350244 RepID=UPI003F8785FF